MSAGRATTLDVGPSPGFPRRLVIACSSLSVWASFYTDANAAKSLAYANASRKHDMVYLDMASHTLWLSGAAFDLSADEAQQVRETFEPLGLTIKTDSPPSTATQAAVDHEAAAASDPLGGERGTPPSPVSSGEGALDFDVGAF